MGILLETALFLAAAVVAVPIARRAGFGSVLGYLAAGLGIGPQGLGLITDVDDILQFSKIGVVLLLFLIGLELQPARLWVLRHTVFGLGALQLAACAVPIGLAAAWAGLGPGASVIVGVGLAFSSTALVLQSLAEREELTSQHGRSAFAIVLFKYVALVPLLAALPLLGGGLAGLEPAALVREAALAVGVLAVLVIGGRLALGPVLTAVASTGTHETFAATGLLVVIGSALAAEAAGLSMGIGALVAGALLADSAYRHEIEADIDPFKGLLLGLFFIAVGMSLDLGLLVEAPGAIGGMLVGLIALKVVITWALARTWGLEGSAARALAATLSQAGELGMVVFAAAVEEGVLAAATADRLILVVALSMAATPLIVLVNERLVEPRLDPDAGRPFDTPAEVAPSVIIAGFGRFGQVVGRLLQAAGIPWTALEVDPKKIDFLRRYGNRIYYGDASRLDLLRAADIDNARAVILSIADVEASVRTAERLRQNFPHVPVFARARNRQHAYRLRDLGVRVVIREVLPASLELGEAVLGELGWSRSAAREAAARFRAHDERTLERLYAVHTERDTEQLSRERAAEELAALFADDEADPRLDDLRRAGPAGDEGPRGP